MSNEFVEVEMHNICIDDALSVNIPTLFDEKCRNVNREYRLERIDRIRKGCEIKYGISSEIADPAGVSFYLPENFDEKKFIKMLIIFISAFDMDDMMSYRDMELESEENREKFKYNYSLTTIKIYAKMWYRLFRFKLSLYQWWLIVKDFMIFSKQWYNVRMSKEKLSFDLYDKYTDYRRIDITNNSILIFWQKCFDISFDRQTWNNELMKRLNRVYMDLVWQLNDLHSFSKEFIRNEHSMNAITVLKNEHHISWQKAVDMLANIIANNKQEFMNCCELLEKCDLNVPFIYLECLKSSIIFSETSYKNCKRYYAHNN